LELRIIEFLKSGNRRRLLPPAILLIVVESWNPGRVGIVACCRQPDSALESATDESTDRWSTWFSPRIQGLSNGLSARHIVGPRDCRPVTFEFGAVELRSGRLP
jgi:hypothetical protein